MKQVESYFKTYPNDECFTTSDGMVFHKKGDANLHSSSLEDKEVETHQRAKYVKPETAEPKVKEAKATKEPKATKESKEAAATAANTGSEEPAK